MANRLPVLALAFYAVCSLSAMASMNIGFFAVFAFLIFVTFTPLRIRSSDGSRSNDFLSLPELRRYFYFGGALFAACLLSLIVARFYPVIYADHAPEITVHGFLKIWYLFCPLVLLAVFARSPGREADLKIITRTWWQTTCVLAVVAVIQFYTGWPLRQVIPTNPNHFHAILFFGHHLSTSSIIVFPTFTAFCVALGAYTREKRLDRFAWTAAGLGILILFLSYARTAWLAIPIGVIFVFARYLRPRTLIASTLTLFAFIGLISQTPLLKERIENNMGIQDRLRLWQANIDFFKHNPLTGIGWLKTQEMSEFYFKSISPDHYKEFFWGHAHSNFFEMLGGTGLLGLGAFLAWSYFTLALAYRTSTLAKIAGRAELSDFCWGLLVGLLLLHFNGLTNVTFWEGKVMHQQMWAVALLLMIQLILKRRNSNALDA